MPEITNHMATKKKVGRPKKSDNKKIKTRYVYLTDEQETRVRRGFKDLTKAVLSKCG